MNILYKYFKKNDKILIKLKELSTTISNLVPMILLYNNKYQQFELKKQLFQTSQEFFILCEKYWTNYDVQRIAFRMAPLIGWGKHRSNLLVYNFAPVHIYWHSNYLAVWCEHCKKSTSPYTYNISNIDDAIYNAMIHNCQ